jgi:alanine-synthesizing transaminase
MEMSPRLSASIPVASRVSGFTYAIRNIVAEARKVEAAGRRVRYLNIGDPVPFGFHTPPELIEAVERAMRDGHNGYGPSPGIREGREAVAADFARNGWPMTPDRVVLTAGTSEGIELALSALVEPGDEVLVPVPTYPLYTAVIAKLGGRALFYRTDPARGWLPDVEQISSLVGPRTRALVVIDPNNPTGAVYPTTTRRALIDIAEMHGVPIIADEVYADLAYDGPTAPLGSLNPAAPIISFSSLSKAYLAPGWRAGWLAVGRSERMDDVLAAMLKLADGRLCSTVPMQYAITAALTGARAHQASFRKALAARAAVTTDRLNAVPRMSCVAPRGAFYAMPRVDLPPGRTDEEYVLALLRETGVLCVYGSGFGTAPQDGYFRVVFLASPRELSEIYDLIAEFTSRYLAS